MVGTVAYSCPNRRAALPERPTLADKVAHLSRAASYGGWASAVEIIETHMSYVFLVDHFVYKLKKPVRYPFLDFSTLEARRFNCEEELRLNRRLARDVYLDVVPLTLSSGRFELGGSAEPVEWLVKMRRLPRRLMLDQAIQEGRVSDQDLSRLTRVLAAFYRDAERVPLTASDYRERLERAIEHNHQSLSQRDYGLCPALLAAIRIRQLHFLERHAGAFDTRVQNGKILEGHGDLRPEHVCLGAEPVVIDCLEFNRDLRIVDAADELAYLAMECEFLGAPEVGRSLLAAYRAATEDVVSDDLIAFYQAARAVLRAKLAAFHLEDHLDANDRVKWITRARDYLHLAERHAARLA